MNTFDHAYNVYADRIARNCSDNWIRKAYSFEPKSPNYVDWGWGSVLRGLSELTLKPQTASPATSPALSLPR